MEVNWPKRRKRKQGKNGITTAFNLPPLLDLIIWFYKVKCHNSFWAILVQRCYASCWTSLDWVWAGYDEPYLVFSLIWNSLFEYRIMLSLLFFFLWITFYARILCLWGSVKPLQNIAYNSWSQERRGKFWCLLNLANPWWSVRYSFVVVLSFTFFPLFVYYYCYYHCFCCCSYWWGLPTTFGYDQCFERHLVPLRRSSPKTPEALGATWGAKNNQKIM